MMKKVKQNDKYELITPGTMGRPFGKKDMVFCIIYCEEGRQYENYDYFLNSPDPKQREKANLKVPTVLSISRQDGKRGFVGGNVESYHNTLIEAVKQELEEEINLVDIDESRLEPFRTFANSKRHITTYLYRVSYEELLEIDRNSIKAKHRYSEVCGVDLMQLHYLSIPNLEKTIFSGTGKDELNALIDSENIERSERIKNALELAKIHFEPILRNNGKNYYEDHILKVYKKVKDLGFGEEYQLIAILHDMFEDTKVTYDYIAKEFGKNIADCVEILTIKKGCPMDEYEAVKKATENEYTKIVRFADRLSNLEQTSFKTNDNSFIKRIVNKTESYYIPNFDGELAKSLKKEVMRLKNELYHCPNCYGELEAKEFGYVCRDCGLDRE